MITPAEADALIHANLPKLSSEDCPLEICHGRVLREPVAADRDFPPFDRVTMDGYAVSSERWRAGARRFRVVGMQPAGTMPLTLGQGDEAVEIATGAVLPHGADAVIPYEETVRDGGYMEAIQAPDVPPFRSIHRKGSDAVAGQVLLTPGTRLSGREIAVAASCGRPRLRVSALPRIAVVATGDELIDVDNRDPAPHQVRRSNDYALRASLLQAGYPHVERFHLRDHKYELEQQLKRLMSEFDMVVLSGGVSKGKYDFLPTVLAELGVSKCFQGVAQRPGKPFWFGITPRKMPVFALPGNPVSTFTCLHRYVLPALAHMAQETPRALERLPVAEGAPKSTTLTLLVPVRVEVDENGRRLGSPMASNTSGDFTGLVATDGFVEIAPGSNENEPRVFRPWR